MAAIAWQLVACLLVADFLTGVAHWVEDCYGLPTWPFLGPHIVTPNIEHHRSPGLIGSMGGLWFRNWPSIVLAAIVLSIAWLAGLATWQLAATAAIAACGAEVHMWAHRPDKTNAFVRFLQEAALIQTPQQHARHHRPPYDSYYCAITNWLNPALERLKFWRRLEAVVSLAGVKPKRMSAERGYL